MADELNIPTHRYYQPRNNIKLAKGDFSKQWIYDSGIQKIDAWINSQPWGSFSPAALFALAEPGVWYDPSDTSTLFQDPAGTTPVTAPGNTVGLMLDKSKGLTLGTELVANGDFSSGTTTGWTAQVNATISIEDGQLKAVASSPSSTGVWQDLATVAGKTYRLTASIRGTAGTLGATAYNGAFASIIAENLNYPENGILTAGSLVFTAISTQTRIIFSPGATATTYYIDNISVKELPGNHAVQATFANRPLYGIVPFGGRRNLVIVSEPTKAQLTATTAGVTDAAAFGTFARSIQFPVGANTEYTYLAGDTGWVSGVTANVSVYVRMDDGLAPVFGSAVTTNIANDFAITARGSLIAPDTYTTTDLGGGIYRVSATGTTGANASNSGVVRFATNSGRGFRVTGYTLELGSTTTPYQRVTTQYDVTEAGVPSCSYLFFDGGSDFMVTPTITPGIDKAQVFAGMRKLSDATVQALYEFSPNSGTNNGSFLLYPGLNSALNGSGPYLVIQSRGSSTVYTPLGASYPAPVSLAHTWISDISAPVLTQRINGTQDATTTGSQGTGNYLAYPLYIGARAGTSSFFSGHLYSLITRFGPNLDAATIASTETYVAGKTGITL